MCCGGGSRRALNAFFAGVEPLRKHFLSPTATVNVGIRMKIKKVRKCGQKRNIYEMIWRKELTRYFILSSPIPAAKNIYYDTYQFSG